jgi:hypothetical protein
LYSSGYSNLIISTLFRQVTFRDGVFQDVWCGPTYTILLTPEGSLWIVGALGDRTFENQKIMTMVKNPQISCAANYYIIYTGMT